MNIHVPQDYQAINEIQELSDVRNHLFGWQKYNPNLTIVQDDLLGIYLLTRLEEKLSKSQVIQLCQSLLHCDIEYTQEWYTGKEIFSFILPNELCYEMCGVKILYGKLLEGFIDKRSLNGSNSIFRYIDLIYDENIVLEFMSNITFLSVAFLQYHSHSVHLGDCKINNYHLIQQSIDKYECEAELVNEMFTNEIVRENNIVNILHKAKDHSMKLVKENFKSNNFLPMIESGSKGSMLNFVQIGGILGQQHFQGERMKATISDNTRALPCYDFTMNSIEDKYESQGFIRNSFYQGLNPREFYFHCVSGRESIVDSANKTADTGYSQRRSIKLSEDIITHYDSTVRNVNGKIIMFEYNDGMCPKYNFDVK
jgi:DNA-directed RNA polymerase beta' subunit